MPATSKAQARYFRAVLNKSVKNPGISMTKAKDFVKGVPLSGLPERVRRPSGIESRATKLKGMSNSANKGDKFGY